MSIRKLVMLILSLLGLVAVVFGATSLVKADIARTPHFDVYDEAAHFDYVAKLHEGSMPSWGSKYGQSTLLIADCLGSVFSKPGNCDNTVREPESIAPSGFSYEAQQPPLGYIPHFMVFELKDSPLETLQTIRANGALTWLTITLLLLVLLAIVVGLAPPVALIFAAIVILNPTFIHAISTINNDASVVPAVLFWMLIEGVIHRTNFQKRATISLRVLSGAVLGLSKGFLLLLPLSFSVLKFVSIFIRSSSRRFKPKVREWASVGENTTFVAAALAYLAFLFYQSKSAILPSNQVLEALLGFSKTDLPNPQTYLESLGNMAILFKGAYFGSLIDLTISDLLTLFATAVIALAARTEINSIRKTGKYQVDIDLFSIPVTGALLALVLMALIWPTLVYIQGHFNFAAANRYALIALPLLAFQISSAFRSRLGLKIQ